jgi:hypothetical protein
MAASDAPAIKTWRRVQRPAFVLLLLVMLLFHCTHAEFPLSTDARMASVDRPKAALQTRFASARSVENLTRSLFRTQTDTRVEFQTRTQPGLVLSTEYTVPYA